MRPMLIAKTPWVAAFVYLAVALPAQAQQHPLDPLSTIEIETAAKILTGAPQFPQGGKFATIVLKEPPKQAVLAYTPGAEIRREALVIVLDRPANRTFEAIVDLGGAKLASWREVKGVQPVVLESEYDIMVRAVRADPRWQAAMKKRGIDDLSKVQIDNWAV